jgi:hypothetical protein
MNTSPEAVPTVWTSADETFFRYAYDLFSPNFLAGAGVLLASYDSDAPATHAVSIEVVTTGASVDATTPATA